MANRKARIDKEHAHAPDQYDEDLERDNRREAEGNLDPEAEPYRPTAEEHHASEGESGRVYPQTHRKGQAQSPVEETPNQPEKHREGHH